ncbi:MAG: hypothetical protein HKM90_07265 [Desulfobacteraceae bacterium]|nr:hypothetical protein [Desulfobacteraceae bacterium]
MNIPNTNITLEEVLDQMPLNIQFVDNNGFVRYLNKAAAARPAKGKREVGVNIQNCHARPESLETIGRILKDFRSGRKEPHYYINKEGNKSIMVPIFNAEDEFIGTLTYSHPVGYPEPERTFY